MSHPFYEPPSRPTTDALPVRGTPAEVLDLDKVATHLENAIRRRRYTGSADPLDYLKQRHCLVEIDGDHYTTVAGTLCFGRNPQALFPRATVDIGHYRGLTPVSFEVVHLDKDIGGTIFDQLARVETYLWTNTHHGMTVPSGSFERVEIHEYPQIVIRELCVNMLAHRDYTINASAARVMQFKNRIEWASPGSLPPGVTVENILNEQHSRNPLILSIMYDSGYVEAFGQGLDTVVTVLQDEGLSPPTFQDTGSTFIVTAFGRDVDAFANDMYTQLSEPQRKIVDILRSRGQVSPQEIRDILPDRSRRSIQRDTSDLVDANLIEVLGEGRALRYRLRDRSS
jgi:predicted HTH transcriptional regulator